MKSKNVQTWKIVFRELQILRVQKRSYLYIVMFLRIVAAGSLPYVLTFVPKLFLEWLSSGEVALNSHVAEIGLLFTGLMFLSVLGIVSNCILDLRLTDARRDELQKFQEWYQQIKYMYLEDASFAFKSESAIDALGGATGFFDTYFNLIELAIFAVTTVLCSISLIRIEPLIVLVCVLIMLVKGAYTRKIGSYIKENESKRSRLIRQKKYYSDLGYDYAYGKDIRIFELSGMLLQKFKRKSEEYVQNIKGIAKKEWKTGTGTEVLLLLRNGLSFLFIALLFYRHRINISDVIWYLGMVVALNEAMDLFTDRWVSLVKNASFASNYFELIDEGQYHYGPEKEKLQTGISDIRFEHVGFRYPKTDAYVLQDINLQVTGGEKIAFVGVNGAGKSTLINLMTGLFDVTSGQIKVNGQDITAFMRGSYYNKFSVVFQDVHIYAGTILENVAGMLAEELDRDRAIHCLKAMRMDKKIERLPLGYDTPMLKIIDDAGIEFSGGENQKIVIARALYKDADVYVLDEPTSALDAKEEAEIYELFNQAVKGKTVIYISHRLSSTRFCDQVYLLSKEGIMEQGTHTQLMKQKGEYYRMFQAQGKYYREGGERHADDKGTH